MTQQDQPPTRLVQSKLAIYCKRIGLASPPPVSSQGLLAMQAAHRQSIPFENLDIMFGRSIAIDTDTVFAKLVEARRGGYCFEHNRLLADMLRAAGFTCRLLLARVRLGDPAIHTARLHCLLLVDLDGEQWIADAGFGGAYAPPMPLRDGGTAASGDGAQHRLSFLGEGNALAGGWLLERNGPVAATDGRTTHENWQPQFAFTLDEVAQADCELGNHWTSTHPSARFTNFHVVSRCLPDGFASIVDHTFSLYRAGSGNGHDVVRRDLVDAADYREVLESAFGLAFTFDEIGGLPLFDRL